MLELIEPLPETAVSVEARESAPPVTPVTDVVAGTLASVPDCDDRS